MENPPASQWESDAGRVSGGTSLARPQNDEILSPSTLPLSAVFARRCRRQNCTAGSERTVRRDLNRRDAMDVVSTVCAFCGASIVEAGRVEGRSVRRARCSAARVRIHFPFRHRFRPGHAETEASATVSTDWFELNLADVGRTHLTIDERRSSYRGGVRSHDHSGWRADAVGRSLQPSQNGWRR